MSKFKQPKQIKAISWTLRSPLSMAAVLALGVTAGAAAAQGAASTSSLIAQPSTAPQLLRFATSAAGDPVTDQEQGVSSSVSSTDLDPTRNFIAAANPHLPGIDAMQYGGRQRYGRPRYRGSNTNGDGSQKYTVYGGVGFTLPAGSNSNYLTTNYGFEAGVARNFNKHFGVGIEFDYDKFGLTGKTLDNYGAAPIVDDPTAVADYGLDGNSHIWSFSVQPIYNLTQGDKWGTYVTGGGGFYHKTASFTVPEQVQSYDPYYGYYTYDANVPIQNYTSNSAGLDGGVGVTYKFSKFANQRLFAEVRVVYTFNQYKPESLFSTTGATVFATGYNYFPQNSQSATYLPVKFGIRF